MSGTVHVSTPGTGIVLMEIDRPPVNVMSAEMLATMHEVLVAAQHDESVRAIVLTGCGRAFCSGADLKEGRREPAAGGSSAPPAAGGRRSMGGFGPVFAAISASRAPVVAAVNGLCIGGGLELALCCDLRIASTNARFTAAGVNVGLMASAYRLPRLIGVARAKAMLLTGLPHDARTAEQWGVVTAVHEPDELAAAALQLAERIAGRAPLSVEATKRVVDQAPHLSPEEIDVVIADELAVLVASRDHREALAAFAAKRPPDFTRS
ncbi:MAG: enoyl-CoA hydratase/isomerase family protein [Ilumatobacteraceae bacterium]|nr:enoyl-CoA hydratase/isomerase family protein [Ilumatobacteraceae bacterium]